jgi:mono/diheme cytochrome c family protein
VTLAAAACALLLTAPGAAAQNAQAGKGMEVFAAQKCTQCHAIGDRGNKKGALDDVGSRLTPAQIRDWITNPEGMAAKRTPPSTRKPPMKRKPMKDGEIDALVALLSELKK